MNSGAIRKNLFSFYLVELSRNWVEVTLISWSALPPTLFLSPFLSLSLSFSLSTAGSWNITAAFSPRSKADALPIPASSTDCHSSCQSNAIYLGAQRLLKRGRSKGWRDVMKGWERAGEKKQKGEAEKVRWGCFFFFFLFAAEVQAVFGISISVTKRAGRQGREKQNPGYASHAGPLWSSPGFWQEGCIRRGEGVEAAERRMRRCFDSLSTPSWLFSPIPSW